MTILVTGGAGFIGSNFILYITEKYPDYKIVNLDLLTYAADLSNLQSLENNKNYSLVAGDINDYALLSKLVKQNKIDLIVHFAAESHVDRSITGPDIFLQTNILGTHNILKVCQENKIRLHHVSTDEVFGSLGPTGYFNEHSTYNPQSPYAASKASSDHLVRAWHNTYGLAVTISNCSNNYGPHQHGEKFIPQAIKNLLTNKKIPVYGQGSNVRDWLYVEDHCRALDLIIHRGQIGQTYCVGAGTEMSNLELAKMICALLGQSEDRIELVPDRAGHDFRYGIDSSKIKKELAWQALTDFDTGLRKTIEWYKAKFTI